MTAVPTPLALARDVAKEAGLASMWSPSIAHIIKALDVPVVRSPKRYIIGGGMGQTRRVDGRIAIVLRQGLAPHVAAHVAGHELGHVVCIRRGLRPVDEELFVSEFGDALLGLIAERAARVADGARGLHEQRRR